jgi:tRNA pseudouridine38-40 synthase
VRLLIELAFKGTQYHGWQIQPGAITIQSILQDKISILTQQETLLVGCGRTDAGVHAREYFAHFDLKEADSKLPDKKSLNAILPLDIVIKKIYKVPDDFNARYDAMSRKYIYKIHFSKDPFQCGDSHFLKESNALSLDKLNECSKIISGLQEFNSFVKAGSGLTAFPCTIIESRWLLLDTGQLEYHITANRFVRGMVRLIVGMCVNYALDKISLQQIQEDVLKKRQISKSWSIAAEGLSLVEIKYPEEKTETWRII